MSPLSLQPHDPAHLQTNLDIPFISRLPATALDGSIVRILLWLFLLLGFAFGSVVLLEVLGIFAFSRYIKIYANEEERKADEMLAAQATKREARALQDAADAAEAEDSWALEAADILAGEDADIDMMRLPRCELQQKAIACRCCAPNRLPTYVPRARRLGEGKNYCKAPLSTRVLIGCVLLVALAGRCGEW